MLTSYPCYHYSMKKTPILHIIHEPFKSSPPKKDSRQGEMFKSIKSQLLSINIVFNSETCLFSPNPQEFLYWS